MEYLIQIIGYIASALLAISLLVTNDLKFRWLNTFGCVFFIIYGVLINAFPIILTNTTLLLINAYYLVKIHRTEEDFDMIEFKDGGQLLQKFFKFYYKDIKSYFPDYEPGQEENDIQFVVLRDMVIANVFVASVQSDGQAVVKFNYTVPKYRDYKVGTYIFEKEKKYLTAKGVKEIVYTAIQHQQHATFLKKMGFVENNNQFKKGLD